MPGSRMKLCESARNAFLSTINYCLEIWRVDLVELGNDKVWGSGGGYRDLRPWSCCGGLPPDEEMEWHTHHIKNCFIYVDEMQDFCKQLTELIKRKGKQLNEKKKQTIKRVEDKDVAKKFFVYSKHAAPLNICTNSQQLAEKEQEMIQEIKLLSSQAQADEDKRKEQEEENERLRKEEEEKWQREKKEWEEKMKQDQEKWEKDRKENEEWFDRTNKEREKDKNRQQDEKPNSQKQEEEKEFLLLIALIQDCQDLAILEKNYQIVKNNSLYSNSKETFVGHGGDNKARLDNFYIVRKNSLQPNHQGTNPPTQQQPIINTQSITQAKSISEAITNIKTQIQQALKSHNLKTSDLPPKYQNWEEQLTKLKSKEEINSLVAELNKQIENKSQKLKRGQDRKNNNQQTIPLHSKIFLGIGVSGVILGIIIFRWAIKRKKKLKKQGKL